MRTFAQFLESKQDLSGKYKDTTAAQPNISQLIDDIKVQRVSVKPDPEAKTILFKARVNDYDTSVMFKNVQYKPVPEDGQLTFGHRLVTAPDGKRYYFELLGYRGNDVAASCTCPHYKNRLTGSNRICKHILRLSKYVKEKGALTTNSADNSLWNPDSSQGYYDLGY